MANRKSGRGSTRFGTSRSFNKKNIGQVPDDNPAVYEGLSASGKNLYTGSAKRGRVQERLLEHLNTKDLPGVKSIRIKPMPSITAARAEEKQIIKQEDPKLNKTD